MGKNTKKSLVDSSYSEPKIRLTKEKELHQNITFSFRFFKQIDYLGLSGKSADWFVGFINRLQDISCKTEEFFRDPCSTSGYRLHKIKWDQKGIRHKREDFNWVDKRYLDNPEEYEFLQFEISISAGRVVGFIDESGYCFNIVAIDPLHNLQPCKKHNWKLQKTYIQESEIENLLSRISRKALLSKALEDDAGDLLEFDNYCYCAIDKDLFAYFESVVTDSSVRKKFQDFILHQV